MTAEQLTADAMRRATIEAGRDDDTCALAWSDALTEAGDESRAEFVRVQCELANGDEDMVNCHPSKGFALAVRLGELKLRQAELLQSHEHEWRAAGPCVECGGTKRIKATPPGGSKPCPHCWSGDRGGLLRTIGGTICPDCVHWKGHVPKDCRCKGTRRVAVEYLHPVRWRRGLPDAVECRLGEVLEARCPVCDSTWEESRARGGGCISCDGGHPRSVLRPPAWAKAVATHHPSVTRFVLTDREPREYTLDGVKVWLWDDGYQGIEDPADLPPPVYMALKKGVRTRWYVWYPTRDDAIDAVAVAACEVVRG